PRAGVRREARSRAAPAPRHTARPGPAPRFPAAPTPRRRHRAGSRSTAASPWPSAHAPEVALAAALAQQLRRAEYDRMRERLAHVVHGERGDGGAGQGLHLDARAVGGLHRALDPKLALAVPVDGDAHAVD